MDEAHLFEVEGGAERGGEEEGWQGGSRWLREGVGWMPESEVGLWD